MGPSSVEHVSYVVGVEVAALLELLDGRVASPHATPRRRSVGAVIDSNDGGETWVDGYRRRDAAFSSAGRFVAVGDGGVIACVRR